MESDETPLLLGSDGDLAENGQEEESSLVLEGGDSYMLWSAHSFLFPLLISDTSSIYRQLILICCYHLWSFRHLL